MHSGDCTCKTTKSPETPQSRWHPMALATISSRHHDSELSVLTSPFTGEGAWRESPQEAGEGFRFGWVFLRHCGPRVLIL